MRLIKSTHALARLLPGLITSKTRIFMSIKRPQILLLFCIAVMLSGAATGVDGQTKKKKPAVKKAPVAVQAEKKVEPKPEPTPVVVTTKRNERPTGNGSEVSDAASANATPVSGAAYRYEFSQPEFINSRILIEHDESGKGKLSFVRRGSAETFTDPITVSTKALERLKAAYDALSFLDSSEEYQDKRDFSHLGVVKIGLKKEGKERHVTFNYTLNKNAKLLLDEYRKITNQFLWVFDISIARENQPLDSPNQMNALDSLIKRNEISDGEQMLPFLRELSDDERLPLIARNHATRIVQNIEKAAKKSK